MTRDEQLDAILLFMASTNHEIQRRPEILTKGAGLEIERATSYLLLNQLHLQKYVENKGPAGDPHYIINGVGEDFILNGGYTKQAVIKKYGEPPKRNVIWYDLGKIIAGALIGMGLTLAFGPKCNPSKGQSTTFQSLPKHSDIAHK